MQENDHTGSRPGLPPLMAGVQVREDDIEPTKGLHLAAIVFRVAAVVIFLLGAGQFAAWWMDRPPGGIGVGVLIGDTIRLTVVASLLWAASDLANLMVKTHYDVRAGRILLARQAYMMRQTGIANGVLPDQAAAPEENRRDEDDMAKPD